MSHNPDGEFVYPNEISPGWRELFSRMTFTPEQQSAADSQGASRIRFLTRCKYDNDVNCWHYDPLAKMTPEERENL